MISHAKVFQSGNSQAVRLSKEFRFDTTEVEIYRRGEEVVLRPVSKKLERAFEVLTRMPDDFLSEGREDSEPQERASF